MNMIMENSLTVIFVPGAWFASRLLKSKIRLLISVRDPPPSSPASLTQSPRLLWICSCELCSHSLTHSRDGHESFTVMQEVLKRMPRSTSVTPPPPPPPRPSPSPGRSVQGPHGDHRPFTREPSTRAARWSACASAPPSGPCSSDSLSSAAECLPVSGTRRTRLLEGGGRWQTREKRWSQTDWLGGLLSVWL